jgi:hypothetical protein
MGKGPSFLQEVKEVNEKTTVVFPVKVGVVFYVHLLQLRLHWRRQATI